MEFDGQEEKDQIETSGLQDYKWGMIRLIFQKGHWQLCGGQIEGKKEQVSKTGNLC